MTNDILCTLEIERKETLAVFKQLLNIMDELREKCPWDKKQTWESLKLLTLEESYELADAILNQDIDEVKKELGDLLLHIVFYCKIAEEKQHFSIQTVIESLNAKMIRRHPHVFGEQSLKTEEQVKQQWAAIKAQEQVNAQIQPSILAGVPQILPALLKAHRLQDKAASVGFDWQEAEQVWEKVQEELAELREHSAPDASQNFVEMENEFGDVLFALVNYARFLKIDPETALEKTNRKFIQRFKAMEEYTLQQNRSLAELSLTQLEELWQRAKQAEMLAKTKNEVN